MAQFDVHMFKGRDRSVRYAVDLQSKAVENLNTRVVAPLRSIKLRRTIIDRLHPVFEISGENYFLSTEDLASMPAASLGPKVASLKIHDAKIIAALDLLLTGI